jgi:perosamine synthetase
VEDAAEAHGAEYHSRRGASPSWKRCGSFGTSSTFSFYANKIITTGEGGMVTTSDDALVDRLRSLRNLAYGREERLVHEDVGFNFRMTGYQAALGLSQLGRIDETITRKRRLAHVYDGLLEGVTGIRGPVEEPWARSVYWMYGVVLGDEVTHSREEVRARLRERGVDTRTFFCPMNLQPALQRVSGFRAEPCPVAERIWERGLYLPSSPALDDATLERVVGDLRWAAGL